MPRFVFFLPGSVDSGPLAAAKKAAQALNVTVVRGATGSMLVETTLATASRLAKELPGWRFAPERKTTRVPERTPLERAKIGAMKTRRLPSG